GLAGRRALVGYAPAGPRPPADWGLLPGVVSILDSLPERPAAIVEAHRAYRFYARNQSLELDVEILIRAFLRARFVLRLACPKRRTRNAPRVTPPWLPSSTSRSPSSTARTSRA